MSEIFKRLTEPSTYAGIAAILVAFNVNLGQEMWDMIVQAAIGLFGLVAFLLKEKDKA